MREGFKMNLKQYNKIAKDELAKPEDSAPEKLENVLDWHLDKTAAAAGTSKETQKAIYELQIKKQAIMIKLKESLARLDDETPEDSQEDELDSRRVVQINEQYYWLKGKDKKKVTLGELVTDGDWGMKYSLDAQSIPRTVRKRFLIEQAKRELQDYLDNQIIVNESSSKFVDEKKRSTYSRILEDKQHKTREQTGLIAEKMVKNFLKKLSIDFGLDYKIINIDVYQDVSQKIDFIIKRKVKERGVKIEDNKNGLGIQFTINDNRQGAIDHKKQQIERAKRELQPEDKIEDIVLVSIPMRDIKDKYKEWSEKKFVGGPDKLWSTKDKEAIFRGIMNKFLTPEEIEEHCNKLFK
jgi:hypothetical protein